MHEQGMIRALLRQVERLCAVEGAKRVTRVDVEVGPLTGAEPLQLETAFRQLKTGTSASDAEFAIHETTLAARCDICNVQFEVAEFCFRCPQCDGAVELESGDQFTLVSVSLET